MRPTLILFATLFLTVTISNAQPWPDKTLGNGERLLFNEAMFRGMRERIDKHDWAKAVWTRLQDQLSQPPAPQLGEGERFAIGIWNKNAALHYRISGDESHLPEVLSSLVSAFKLDKPGEALFPSDGKPVAWDWCMYNSNLLVAYDLLKTHPSFAPYKELMDARLDELIASASRFLEGRKTVNNTGFWVSAVLGMAGWLRDNRPAICEAVDGPCGFKGKLMEFREAGRFNPEPINYTTNYVDGCLLILAECSRNNSGEDLYSYVAPNGASLKRLADSYFELANAGGMAVGNGDFGDYVLMDGAKPIHGGIDIFHGKYPPHRSCDKMEIFNARYHDPKFAWAIAQNPARDNSCFVFWGWTSLTHGEDISNAAAPKTRSVVLPEMGSAIVRSVEDTTYWNSDALTAHLRSGLPLKTHNQKDHFNLTLNAFGKNIYKDWFLRWDYLAPKASNGKRNATPLSPRIIGHNTVSVDFSEPTLSNVEFSPIRRFDGAQVVSVSGEVYKGLRQKRTIVVTEGYVIDVFTLDPIDDASTKERNFDFALHSLGSAAFTGVGPWTACPELNTDYKMKPIDAQAARPGNVWFKDARKAPARKDVTVDFKDEDRTGVRAVLLNDSETEVIQAGTPYFVSIKGWDDISPDATIPERKPMAVFRRKGSGAEFCVLHQPYMGKPSKLRFSREGNVLKVVSNEYSDSFDLSSLEFSRVGK